MAESLGSRLKHAWNAFVDIPKKEQVSDYRGPSYGFGSRPHQTRYRVANRGSIIVPIFNRIGIDVAAVNIRHARMDENGRFVNEIKSGLNECLSLDPNIDQTASAFFIDAAMTMCEKGVIAIVAIETTINPEVTDGYDVANMRIGEVTDWYAEHVRVNVYNQRTGMKEELILPKKIVAIIENPLYSVMNEQNSILQRLLRKLELLDVVDEQAGSGKLDLIVQLPYQIKTAARQDQAEKRRQDIEIQLADSKYGIAYLDATEKITQLNRPAENNMLKTIDYLTKMLYGQLGITEDIMNGVADEAAMVNYFNRTIAPMLVAITQGMKRTFLSKTARTQGQSIEFFRDPFKLVPVSQISEIADKFSRNEILTPNELRSYLGIRPSQDPKADELRNRNIAAPTEEQPLAITDGKTE